LSIISAVKDSSHILSSENETSVNNISRVCNPVETTAHLPSFDRQKLITTPKQNCRLSKIMDPTWIPLGYCSGVTSLRNWCGRSVITQTNDQATRIHHYFLSVLPRIQQHEELGFGFEKTLDLNYETLIPTLHIVSTVWVTLGFCFCCC
jgi:hypothetical protein